MTDKRTGRLSRRLSPAAYEIFVKRYSLKNDEGKLVETPEEIVKRVAGIVSQAENNYRDGITVAEVMEKFEDLMLDQRFLPNGRTLANAGMPFGQLANCFVLPIEDELGKTEQGIFSILRKAILILQTGGGVGFSFGRIRPKGDSISTSKGEATGAISFLKIYDTAFEIIGQGGGRRSAAMAVLPVWHPDIFEFISVKAKEGLIVNFNISVGITDEFMKAVEADDWFHLRNPRTYQPWKRIKARTLFNEIVKYAHNNGEPGVLFLDAANRDNPIPNVYDLEATNPCGEQFLGPYENCCLGSINLLSHVKKSWRARKENGRLVIEKGEIDWQKLAESVYWVVRFLDDVIDVNRYVPAVPELDEAAKKARRIGLSMMGLADLMYEVGVVYGSEEGIRLAGLIMEFIRYHAMLASIELAKERGPFPLIKGSIYDPEIVGQEKSMGQAKGWRPPSEAVEGRGRFGRPRVDWRKVVSGIKKHGIRNAAQTTVAPTGAIATVSALEGYGCEPVFALSYIMRTHEGAGDGYREISYESSLFKAGLERVEKAGVKIDKKQVFETIRQQGSCQQIKELPQAFRRIYKVSADVSIREHVLMQAALQRYVDNSISKTINCPEGSTAAAVHDAYLLGWKMGVKGMTVYVSGSREHEVLQKKAKSGVDFSPSEDNGFRTSKITKVEVHSGPICPECGGGMQVSEGCYTCRACGYSKCDS
ncbi:MAG: adenosylcobalamin-dependent ribonucleoside-diphosphate reductase [bacterium]|nr:adenosylcobalamin-dependent ribonucleoside-diphosphate reductase [bacterium]